MGFEGNPWLELQRSHDLVTDVCSGDGIDGAKYDTRKRADDSFDRRCCEVLAVDT